MPVYRGKKLKITNGIEKSGLSNLHGYPNEDKVKQKPIPPFKTKQMKDDRLHSQY